MAAARLLRSISALPRFRARSSLASAEVCLSRFCDDARSSAGYETLQRDVSFGSRGGVAVVSGQSLPTLALRDRLRFPITSTDPRPFPVIHAHLLMAVEEQTQRDMYMAARPSLDPYDGATKPELPGRKSGTYSRTDYQDWKAPAREGRQRRHTRLPFSPISARFPSPPTHRLSGLRRLAFVM